MNRLMCLKRIIGVASEFIYGKKKNKKAVGVGMKLTEDIALLVEYSSCSGSAGFDSQAQQKKTR